MSAFVKVGRMPGTPVDVEITEGMTVGTAIAAANLDGSGYEIRLNGLPTELDNRVTGGDMVVLLTKIKGA